ncbi:MAG: hypothetical protein ACOCQW_04005 [Halanaerobiaceae bacterium]
MFELPSIKKVIKTSLGRLVTGLVCAVLSAVLINSLLISLTNLSSETRSLLAISISIGLGLFVEESLKKDNKNDLISRIMYSIFCCLFSGLAIYLLL